MITVIQVFEAMGINPTPDQSWSVGSRIATAYRRTTGKEPEKELRQKTSGGGSHMFAVYPTSWYGLIDSAIKSVSSESRSQGDFFA